MSYSKETESFPENFSSLKDAFGSQLETLVGSMDCCIFLLDEKRNYIQCFQSRLLQLIPPDLLTGKNITAFPFSSTFLATILIHFDQAERTGKLQSFDHNLTVNKKSEWLNCSIAKIKSVDSFEGFILVIRETTALQESMQLLKTAKEKYELLAENATDLFVLYSPEGKIEYISPSVKQLLGYDPESMYNIDPSAYIHPDDLTYIQENFHAEYYVKDAFFSAEYRLRHANGDWVHFSTNRKPIRDSLGKVTHILACCSNITDRIVADAATKKSEAHYKLLADNILDLVALHNVDGVFEYVSPSSLNVLGYKPEELLGLNVFELIHPEEAEGLLSRNREKAHQGLDKFIDMFRILHKEGHWVYFETTTKIIKADERRSIKFLTTSRDITEWQLAKSALQESEEKYRSLIEASDALISVLDKNGICLFGNEIKAKFHGLTRNEIIGKSMYDLYGKDVADNFMEQFKVAINENVKMVYETPVLQYSNEFWLRVTIKPMANQQGEVYAALVNSIDITAIKQSQKRLRMQNEELRNIAFMQSHIVRSPLSNLKALLNLVHPENFSEENKHIFQLLNESADKLDNVIKEIVHKTYTSDNI